MLPAYRHLFVGHSNNIYYRLHGSSGGVGTALLHYLLATQEVDGVIGVGFDDKDKTRAIYKFINDPAHIIQLSGSKYVYMSLEPLLKLLRQYSSKKIAVVVEPCFVKAIRRMAPHCRYVISFFCGYNITSEGTDYLIQKSKIDPKNIEAIDYRGGSYPGGFTIYTKEGEVKSFKKEHYELVDLLFLKDNCAKCRLFISDEADIVLGDAWLKNYKNMTLLVVNTPLGEDLIFNMYQKQWLTLYDIDKESVIKMHSHNLHYKNKGHSFWMKGIVFLFNNRIAVKIAPLYFLGWLSKIRRALMVGADITLKPAYKHVQKFSEKM